MQKMKADHKIIGNFLGRDDFSYIENEDGCNNFVYDIENTYILRESRNPEKNFDVEICVLDQIKGFTNFFIPKVCLQGKDKEWMLYPKIPGTMFSFEALQGLSKDQYENIVDELASFLSFLHPFSNNREIIKKEIITYDKSWIHMDRLRKLNIKDKEWKALADSLIDEYETHRNKYPKATLGLLHNDLYDENIFLTKELNNISGIIDFGDTTISDIHNDFTHLYHPENTFRNDVSDMYMEKSGNKLDKNLIKLNWKIFSLQFHLRNPEERHVKREWIEEMVKENL